MDEGHHNPSISHIGKKHVEPDKNWLITVADKLRIDFWSNGPTILPLIKGLFKDQGEVQNSIA